VVCPFFFCTEYRISIHNARLQQLGPASHVATAEVSRMPAGCSGKTSPFRCSEPFRQRYKNQIQQDIPQMRNGTYAADEGGVSKPCDFWFWGNVPFNSQIGNYRQDLLPTKLFNSRAREREHFRYPPGGWSSRILPLPRCRYDLNLMTGYGSTVIHCYPMLTDGKRLSVRPLQPIYGCNHSPTVPWWGDRRRQISEYLGAPLL
jgi:hypothetical protein